MFRGRVRDEGVGDKLIRRRKFERIGRRFRYIMGGKDVRIVKKYIKRCLELFICSETYIKVIVR